MKREVYTGVRAVCAWCGRWCCAAAAAVAAEQHSTGLAVAGLQARVDQLTERIGRQAAVLDKNDLTEFDPVIDIAPRLDGIVLDVSDSNLVEISVGSDDGLRKGHELEISRGDKYLGRIVIVDAFPKRAVAEIIPELRQGRIRRGDRVFTKV